MTSGETLRTTLVLPMLGAMPRTGGWQRSQMFFSAARRMGPVRLVLVSEDGEAAPEGFEGARTAAHVSARRIAPGVRSRRARAWSGLAKLALPGWVYRTDREYARALRSHLHDADVVIFRYIAPFAASGLRARRDPARLICVDVDDRDDQKAETKLRGALPGRLGARASAICVGSLKTLMRRVLGRSNVIFYAAEEDVWPDLAPACAVAPNTAAFAPSEPPASPPSASRTLLFVGSHGHSSNRSAVRWFLREVWPLIRASDAGGKGARFRIVGIGDWQTLRDEPDLDLDGVEIVGAVEDLGAEYAGARISVCPGFESSGSRIKLIEACGFGRAVVATQAAARGFAEELASAIRIADEPRDFARACIDLLSDDEAADAAGAEARICHQTHFARAAVEARIEKIVRDAWAAKRVVTRNGMTQPHEVAQ